METARMQDEIRRALEGDAWHGPSLAEALRGVDARLAAARPVPSAHSAWEIVAHLAAWADFVRRRLDGEIIDDVSDEEDWPKTPEPSDDAWARTRAAADESHRRLLDAIDRFSESRLDETVPGKPWSYYVMVHGVSAHTLYHAGQIVLLKKAAAGSSAAR